MAALMQCALRAAKVSEEAEDPFPLCHYPPASLVLLEGAFPPSNYSSYIHVLPFFHPLTQGPIHGGSKQSTIQLSQILSILINLQFLRVLRERTEPLT